MTGSRHFAHANAARRQLALRETKARKAATERCPHDEPRISLGVKDACDCCGGLGGVIDGHCRRCSETK